MSYETRYAALKRQQWSDRADLPESVAWRHANAEAARLLSPEYEARIAEVLSDPSKVQAVTAWYNETRTALTQALLT